jgi:hypothetical protein
VGAALHAGRPHLDGVERERLAAAAAAASARGLVPEDGVAKVVHHALVVVHKPNAHPRGERGARPGRKRDAMGRQERDCFPDGIARGARRFPVVSAGSGLGRIVRDK